jgi:hypothetical protein
MPSVNTPMKDPTHDICAIWPVKDTAADEPNSCFVRFFPTP